jgi:hypothetical protein
MQDSTVGVHADDHTMVGLSKWPELQMPRESTLLSEMSRQLLRIARLPRVSKPAVTVEEEEKEPAEEEEVKEERKGFSLKRWVQMGKSYDPPEREYLAKRRKGLPPMHDGFAPIYDTSGLPKPMTTMKVRKYDAEGNSHVYDVIAPVGQKVAGEILDDEKAATVPVEPPAAPGTVIEGLGVVNEEGVVVAQPIRRKPPIPQKRKKKGGPGRSKKKIVPELGPDGFPIHPPLDAHGELMSDAPGVTTEGAESGDTPMPDAGDEDDEGSGEEGEVSDEDHDVDMSQASTPARTSSFSNDVKAEAVITPEVPAGLTPGPSSLRTEIRLEPDDSEMITEVKEETTRLEPPPEPALEPLETVTVQQTVEEPDTKFEAEEPLPAPLPVAMETSPILQAEALVPDSEVAPILELPPPVIQEPIEPEKTLPSPKPSSPPPVLSTDIVAPILDSQSEVPAPVDLPEPPKAPSPIEPTGPFSPPKEPIPDVESNQPPEEPITKVELDEPAAEEIVSVVEPPALEPPAVETSVVEASLPETSTTEPSAAEQSVAEQSALEPETILPTSADTVEESESTVEQSLSKEKA